LSFQLLPLDQQPHVTEVRTHFSLLARTVPEGWTLDLLRAKALRGRISQEFAERTGADYRLEFTIGVYISSGTPSGSYVVGGVIKARNTGKKSVIFSVMVN
jgi:hypothetical protein